MKKQPETVALKDQEYYVQVDESGAPITGEIKVVDVVVKEVPRVGFSITYLGSIINMIESIGNKKMQVVKYILQNMDSNNILLKTVREISAGANASLQTVNDTLQILEEAGIIARKTGAVMLSPKLVHKGNARRERILMTKFLEIKNQDSE